MSKILVIVESPGKIAKISQYLGPDYIVKASFGHVQDLDKSTFTPFFQSKLNSTEFVNIKVGNPSK